VYCDPPYVPLTRSANFTSYSAGGFDLGDQQRLADLAAKARARGIPVLISNHNTRFTREVYQDANDIKRFKVQRYISCNGRKREHAGELLALFS
jgi:DNA adenine methylase